MPQRSFIHLHQHFILHKEVRENDGDSRSHLDPFDFSLSNTPNSVLPESLPAKRLDEPNSLQHLRRKTYPLVGDIYCFPLLREQHLDEEDLNW